MSEVQWGGAVSHYGAGGAVVRCSGGGAVSHYGAGGAVVRCSGGGAHFQSAWQASLLAVLQQASSMAGFA